MLLYSIMGTAADAYWLLRDFSDQHEGFLRSSLAFFILLLCEVSQERDYRVITEETVTQNCLPLHLLGSLFLTIVMSNWKVINDESKRDANSRINIAMNLENITGQSRLSA